MNRKSKERFKAWAKKKNEEYEASRIKHMIDKGYSMRGGRSIMPSKNKDDTK